MYIEKMDTVSDRNDQNREETITTFVTNEKTTIVLNITYKRVFINCPPTFTNAKNVTTDQIDNIVATLAKWYNNKNNVSKKELFDIVL